MIGYSIIGLSLFLLVQSKNVYPQLLLARMLFSVGGSATVTMVTAILPSITSPNQKADMTRLPRHHSSSTDRPNSPLTSSDYLADSQNRDALAPGSPAASEMRPKVSSPTRLAGYVGFFTGCGALLALGLFLPLPNYFQRGGVSPKSAICYSFYVAGAVSLTVALTCFVGLRGLRGEDTKGWRNLYPSKNSPDSLDARERSIRRPSLPRSIFESMKLGIKDHRLGLSYAGGFVARASSVGITTFIPLFVNASFVQIGFCKSSPNESPVLKERCQEAYVIAAKLTGVSQLAALLFAPAFGHLADKYHRLNIPLMAAALVGLIGNAAMGTLQSPAASGAHFPPFTYLITTAMGIGQIGVIVCSLGLLGRRVSRLAATTRLKTACSESDTTICASNSSSHEPSSRSSGTGRPGTVVNVLREEPEELSALLRVENSTHLSYEHLKGSIAGMYSLAGGAGILLLTKAGGIMFDKVSPIAPFYFLALFNAILIAIGAFSAMSSEEG